MEFDTKVKLAVYKTIAEEAKVPDSSEIAENLGTTVAEVEAAFQALFQKRLLVLESGTTSKIRMAPPFAGIETEHKAIVNNKVYFANCAWDVLGIAAALNSDADIMSECADSGEALEFEVRGGKVKPRECVIHFAVPPARWWQDIIYT